MFIHIFAEGSKNASFPQQSAYCRSRSFEVDNIGTNQKHVRDFLLVRHCKYGPILHFFEKW